MSDAPEGGTNRNLLVVLTVVAYVVALVLSFYVTVYLTDLAIAPETGPPCNSIWGPATCVGKPAVVAATFLPALAIAVIVWYLGRGGGIRWATILLGALVVATVAVVVVATPNCSGGDTLGIESNSSGDKTTYKWACIGGIK